jgi:hypothetical protein
VTQVPEAVRRWHEVVDCADPARRSALLQDLLSEEVVFRSPAVHTPAEGREAATAYLEAAMVVLGPVMHYERELVTGDSACLEFRAELDGKQVQGVDLIRWDAAGQIVDFTVLVRPIQGLHALMGQMVAALGG